MKGLGGLSLLKKTQKVYFNGFLTLGVHYTKHIQVYVSALKGYQFGHCRMTYIYAIHIIICNYVHIRRALSKYGSFVFVW